MFGKVGGSQIPCEGMRSVEGDGIGGEDKGRKEMAGFRENILGLIQNTLKTGIRNNSL